MLNVRAVTFWVPAVEFTHLTRQKFIEHRDALVEACSGRITVLEPYPFEDLWLVREGYPQQAANKRAIDRFPTDADHLRCNVIQHARTQAAMKVYQDDPSIDVVVWLDYGVMKQGAWRGNPVTQAHIREFMHRVADHMPYRDIPFPGIEPRKPIRPYGDNWRFVGSTHIWPTRFLPDIHKCYQSECRKFFMHYAAVPLDLAIWPAVEARSGLPFRFYQGEYDATQFTGFTC